MRKVVSVPLLSLALAGCDRVLGIEELPYSHPVVDSSVDTPAEAAVPREVACETCAQSAGCAAERAACTGVCKTVLDCQDKCSAGDAVCRFRCEEQNKPAWRSDASYLALDACLRRKCVDACYGTGAMLAAIDGACGCTESGCASSERACLQSDLDVVATPDGGVLTPNGLLPGNCDRRMACTARAANPDGYLDCLQRFPSDATLFDGVLNCARQSSDCAATSGCQLTSNELACVGNYAFSGTADATKKLSIFVGDGKDTSILPFVGARVTACKPGPCAKCQPITDPASTGLTGADGKVTITVPTPGGITPGGGFYSGCLKVEGADYLVTYVDTGRSIHLDEDGLVTLLFKEYSVIVFDPTGNADFATHGHVIGTVHDCLWGGATGATIETDAPGARVYYVADQVMPGWTKTGPKGAFAIFDVPEGNWNITAKVGDTVIDKFPLSMAAGVVVDANIFPQVK